MLDIIEAGIRKLDPDTVQRYRKWGFSDVSIAWEGWTHRAHMLHCLQLTESRRKGGLNSDTRQSLLNAANVARCYANDIEFAYELD